MEIVEHTLTDRNFYALLGLMFLIVQFAYQIWDKSRIEKAVKSFEPHLERGRKMYGILKELSEMHKIRDDDGRPMWYMPREMIEMLRELININHAIVQILERQEKAIDKHADSCQSQFKEYIKVK